LRLIATQVFADIGSVKRRVSSPEVKMSQRTAKFVSAIFASLFLGAPLVTPSLGAPAEAEQCLSGPKGAPPAGGHWYYRTDRATKRRCWFIGDAKEKVARAAPETSPPAANSASPPDSANTQPSIANARAELPLPQARVEPDTSVFTGQRAAAAITGSIKREDDQRANAGDAGVQPSVVASRWPELAGINTPASPGRSAGNSAASAPENSGATPTLSEAAPAASNAAPAPLNAASAASEAAPPPVAAALPLAAADASSTEKPSSSVQMLLIAILGALALAGLLASVIFRLAAPRRTGRRLERRVNWDSVRTDRPSLSDGAQAARSMRDPGLLPRGSLPREQRAADERIARMLSRLPRSTAT
jgi:hypothetical protein